VNAVFKIGLDSGILMKVRLHNGTELVGYITEADEESFVIMREESRSFTRLKYEQVKEVKRYQGTGKKFGSVLGYVATFGIMAVLGISYPRKSGGGSCAPGH